MLGDELVGRLLGGRYRVERLLGQGGMGAVYAGVQEDLGRRIAIKIIAGAVDEQAAERFRREALASAALGHPNIVQVSDFQALPDEPPFLVMELLTGESLATCLDRERALAPPRAVFIACQILSALAAAHAAYIVHRDVKPGNVFIITTAALHDFVKLLDFGIAKMNGPDTTEGGWSTQAGSVVGTVAFMAPEQAMGLAVDGRADVYAVGACLYAMLSGQRPIQPRPGQRPLEAVVRERPAPLALVAPHVPPLLADAVMRALAKDPEHRWQSAAAMIDALAPFGQAAHGGTAPLARTSDRSMTAPTSGALLPRTNMERPVAAPAPLAPLAPSSSSARVVVAIVVVIVGGVAVVGTIVRSLLKMKTPAATTASAASPPSAATLPVIDTRWYALTVGSFVGDSTEDFAGVADFSEWIGYRLIQARRAFVVDGATMRVAWRSEPIELRTSSLESALVAAVGGSIVVTEPSGALHAYDVRTGREDRTVPSIGEPAVQLCANGPRAVWLERKTAPDASFDLGTGELSAPAPLPSGCTHSVAGAYRGGPHLYVGTTAIETGNIHVGKRYIQDVTTDDSHFALAYEQEPDERPARVGLDVTTKMILWRRKASLDDLDLLLEIRHGVAYWRTREGAVAAVDLRTGARLWTYQPTEPLVGDKPPLPMLVRVGVDRVYIERNIVVDVLDAPSGRVLGTVRVPSTTK